ncbi:MAG: hypothetical protein K5755_02485 [Clostridiales bacterium]|nr:hypothetical protein [Clostridiales bacterium]
MSDKLTIIGGDGRFLSVKRFFEKKGFKVNSVFLEKESGKAIYDTVILPVPVMRNGFLNSPLTDEKVSEKRLAGLLPENSTVFGGIISQSFEEICREKNIKLIDYFSDETLLDKNAVLTARAIPSVLEENGVSVSNGRIFILGYGRCGKAIADVLSSAGGNVTVVSSKGKAGEYRLVHFEDLKGRINEASLVVNTVPSAVLTENELVNLNRNAVITEIASAPYGIDFEAAKRLDIKVIKAPSLPGRFFPEEAGEVIAETILKEMN